MSSHRSDAEPILALVGPGPMRAQRRRAAASDREADALETVGGSSSGRVQASLCGRI